MARALKFLIYAMICVVSLAVVGIAALFLYGYLLSYDYSRVPISHIRNDEYIVGLYSERSGAFASRDAYVVTVVDIGSYQRKERVAARISPSRYSPRITDMKFVDKHLVRVDILVGGHLESHSFDLRDHATLGIQY
jgi:hypothetical protein